MSDVRLGALCWNQYTTWPALLEAGRRADRLGFDTLWTWDHLYPIVGQLGRADPRGLADAGGLGPGDRADPDRPDGRRQHVPRAGADGQDGDDPRPHLERAGDPRHRRGLVRDEHDAYGIEFGSGFPERLRWLGEALPIMRGMLHGERPTAAGPRYAAKDVRNDPPPDPGSACRCSSAVAASRSRSSSSPATATRTTSAAGSRTSSARRRSSSSTARPSDAIRPRSSGRPGIGTVIIRDSRAEADASTPRSSSATAGAERWKDQPVGTPEDVAERLLPFLDIGYRHLDRRLPVAARRGVDDPPRDRGPADPRGRLTVDRNGPRLANCDRRRARADLRDLVRRRAGAPRARAGEHDLLLDLPGRRRVRGRSARLLRPRQPDLVPGRRRHRGRHARRRGRPPVPQPPPPPAGRGAARRRASTAGSSASARWPSTRSATSSTRATSGWPARRGWRSRTTTRRSRRARPSSSPPFAGRRSQSDPPSGSATSES